jgi:DNA-binding LytR/AlgR family response regulator
VRIHRSTIVNGLALQSLHKAVDGGLLVRLKEEPHAELPVARDRVRELKERLGVS